MKNPTGIKLCISHKIAAFQCAPLTNYCPNKSNYKTCKTEVLNELWIRLGNIRLWRLKGKQKGTEAVVTVEDTPLAYKTEATEDSELSITRTVSANQNFTNNIPRE